MIGWLFVLLLTNAQAQQVKINGEFKVTKAGELVPLPIGVYTLDNLVDEFRAQLRTKIDEVSKNFYPKVAGTTLLYYNDENTPCPLTYMTSKTKPVIQISVSENAEPGNLLQFVDYISCNQKGIARESFRTLGLSPKSQPARDFWNGKASMALEPTDQEKIYSFFDSKNVEFYRVRAFRTKSGIQAEFSILGSPVLTYEEYQSEEESRISYKGYSYKVEYNDGRTNHRISNQWSKPPYFKVVLNKLGQLFYYVKEPSPRPLVRFNADFSKEILDPTFGIFREAFKEILIGSWPATQFVSSGIKASRLLDELRLNFNRLQTKSELQEVEDFVFQLINNVELGLIEDKRPTQ